jgi:DNA-binding XRE family transcriptional regulator
MPKHGHWPATGFGQCLKMLRNRRHWSQKDLAAKVGCHPWHIGKLETGRSEPSWPMALLLAQALGVSVRVFETASHNAEPMPPPVRGRPPLTPVPA